MIVVGGGPAGVLLTYLLARGGVEVTLLESRSDFARRFRGDTLAPGVLEYLHTLGLADALLAEVPHTRSDAFRWHTPERTWTLVDYRGASRRYPFYALIPQARFLPWLADRAQAYGATVRMGARFSGLRHSSTGRVVGVDYTVDAVHHTLDADLVVGADGRSSKVRGATGLPVSELGASLDILWYSVAREPDDPAYSGLDLFGTRTGSLALLDQGSSWQLGWTIRAGSLPTVRARGTGPLVDAAVRSLPWLAGRLDDLTDVGALSLLPVRITTVERWSRPGLALIGDAAHVISPVGGNGINLALGDAAELANRVLGPLRSAPDPGALDAAVAAVEADRRPAIEREQRGQVRTERSAARRAGQGDPRPPAVLRVLTAVPGFSRFAARRARVELPAPVPAIGTARRDRCCARKHEGSRGRSWPPRAAVPIVPGSPGSGRTTAQAPQQHRDTDQDPGSGQHPARVARAERVRRGQQGHDEREHARDQSHRIDAPRRRRHRVGLRGSARHPAVDRVRVDRVRVGRPAGAGPGRRRTRRGSGAGRNLGVDGRCFGAGQIDAGPVDAGLVGAGLLRLGGVRAGGPVDPDRVELGRAVPDRVLISHGTPPRRRRRWTPAGR